MPGALLGLCLVTGAVETVEMAVDTGPREEPGAVSQSVKEHLLVF